MVNYEVEVRTGTVATIKRSMYGVAMRITGDPLAGNNGLFFKHGDHLGSSTMMTKMDGTTVAGSVAYYMPFGEYRGTAPTINAPLATTFMSDLGYTGHQHNNDLGLVYMNARFYVPGVGKFASADTIIPAPTNPQSYNRYAYVLNNPLNYIDPSGHCNYSADGSEDRKNDEECWTTYYYLTNDLGYDGLDKSLRYGYTYEQRYQLGSAGNSEYGYTQIMCPRAVCTCPPDECGKNPQMGAVLIGENEESLSPLFLIWERTSYATKYPSLICRPTSCNKQNYYSVDATWDTSLVTLAGGGASLFSFMGSVKAIEENNLQQGAEFIKVLGGAAIFIASAYPSSSPPDIVQSFIQIAEGASSLLMLQRDINTIRDGLKTSYTYASGGSRTLRHSTSSPLMKYSYRYSCRTHYSSGGNLCPSAPLPY